VLFIILPVAVLWILVALIVLGCCISAARSDGQDRIVRRKDDALRAAASVPRHRSKAA
jgi:hypothetical protein